MIQRLRVLPLVALCGLPLAAGEEGEKKCAHWSWDPNFGAYAQINAPLHELKDALDGRTGYGIGVQWTHAHGEAHASRTRLEYNVFPEGAPVGTAQTKTYAKNYLLSLDHLFRLNPGPTHVYLVTGLGGVRWVLNESTPMASNAMSTTKLALAGGVGVQIRDRVSLEARYVLSGVRQTLDSNMLQASLGWRF